MTVENTKITVDCGKGILREVDVVRDIHESVFAHVLTRGLKPTLQDCHASVTLDSCGGDAKKQQEESAALVDKMLANMKSGDVRVRGVTREASGDPLSSFRIAALRAMVEAPELAKGQKPKAWLALSKRDDKADVIAKLIAANAEKVEADAIKLKAIADAEAAAKREAAAAIVGGIDLSALGL